MRRVAEANAITANFTPGPWAIDGLSLVHVADASRGGQRVTVADVRHNREANAHLIAAAPELYEALGAFVSAANLSVFDKGADAALANAFDLAERALAKARGE